MNHCIVCYALSGALTNALDNNKVCSLHRDAALLAIVEADRRTKSAILPLSIADRKARRVRAAKEVI